MDLERRERKLAINYKVIAVKKKGIRKFTLAIKKTRSEIDALKKRQKGRFPMDKVKMEKVLAKRTEQIKEYKRYIRNYQEKVRAASREVVNILEEKKNDLNAEIVAKLASDEAVDINELRKMATEVQAKIDAVKEDVLGATPKAKKASDEDEPIDKTKEEEDDL